MKIPYLRALAACALLSSWLVLLFTGIALGGWIHLLLLAALLVLPWRQFGRAG